MKRIDRELRRINATIIVFAIILLILVIALLDLIL
jgi:hypothetical protein